MFTEKIGDSLQGAPHTPYPFSLIISISHYNGTFITTIENSIDTLS